VVNFWASWCVPCREEFPMLKAQLAALGPTDGLVIVGVLYKDQADLARPFVADMGAAWPSITDPDGAIAAAYRVVAPPQTYYIDKDGVLRGIQIGEVLASDVATQDAKIRP
jgi:cytochrome c biogenesis protein CcmG/thiol:disulfide interchange protein DsbE